MIISVLMLIYIAILLGGNPWIVASLFAAGAFMNICVAKSKGLL